jgi:hypothetical protein
VTADMLTTTEKINSTRSLFFKIPSNLRNSLGILTKIQYKGEWRDANVAIWEPMVVAWNKCHKSLDGASWQQSRHEVRASLGCAGQNQTHDFAEDKSILREANHGPLYGACAGQSPVYNPTHALNYDHSQLGKQNQQQEQQQEQQQKDESQPQKQEKNRIQQQQPIGPSNKNNENDAKREKDKEGKTNIKISLKKKNNKSSNKKLKISFNDKFQIDNNNVSVNNLIENSSNNINILENELFSQTKYFDDSRSKENYFDSNNVDEIETDPNSNFSKVSENNVINEEKIINNEKTRKINIINDELIWRDGGESSTFEGLREDFDSNFDYIVNRKKYFLNDPSFARTSSGLCPDDAKNSFPEFVENIYEENYIKNDKERTINIGETYYQEKEDIQIFFNDADQEISNGNADHIYNTRKVNTTSSFLYFFLYF